MCIEVVLSDFNARSRAEWHPSQGQISKMWISHNTIKGGRIDSLPNVIEPQGGVVDSAAVGGKALATKNERTLVPQYAGTIIPSVQGEQMSSIGYVSSVLYSLTRRNSRLIL